MVDTPTTRAKMAVTSHELHANNEAAFTVNMTAVDEAEWSTYTPQGSLSITITNPKLDREKDFPLGKTFYMDLTLIQA